MAACAIHELGIETYLPEYRRRIKHAGKVSEVRRPLLTGYLFASFSLDNPAWPKILSRRGVKSGNRSMRGILCDSMLRPKAVPDNQMAIIREIAAQHEGTVYNYAPLAINDIVRVVEGAFYGRLAKVRWADPGRERVGIIIDGLKIALDRARLEAA